MSLLIAILTVPAVVLFALLFLPCRDILWQPRGESQEFTEEPFSVLCIEQAFDPDQAIIWDTQVPALRMMASAGKKGLPIRALYPLYLRSRRRYPELYDGSSFESWLEFLQHTKLVNISIGMVWLTSEGWEFLRYGVTAAAFVAMPESTMAADRSES